MTDINVEEEDEGVVTRRRLTMADDEEGEKGGNENKRKSKILQLFGRRVPQKDIVFFVQVLLVFVVVTWSLVNLTLEIGSPKLWIALLGSSLGYMLPNPSIDRVPSLQR